MAWAGKFRYLSPQEWLPAVFHTLLIAAGSRSCGGFCAGWQGKE
jgi:hypothetical protein